MESLQLGWFLRYLIICFKYLKTTVKLSKKERLILMFYLFTSFLFDSNALTDYIKDLNNIQSNIFPTKSQEGKMMIVCNSLFLVVICFQINYR